MKDESGQNKSLKANISNNESLCIIKNTENIQPPNIDKYCIKKTLRTFRAKYHTKKASRDETSNY